MLFAFHTLIAWLFFKQIGIVKAKLVAKEIYMNQNILVPLLLTLLAGLSTGIGSLIAFLCKHTNRKFLSVSLGFSAGVMIYVSFVEIFQEAQETLVAQMGMRKGSWTTVLAFFGGILLIAIIDPSTINFWNKMNSVS